ncbi:MAG: hypothetical protein EOP47_17270, partial [Sphingobacteriaceae bacterium]
MPKLKTNTLRLLLLLPVMLCISIAKAQTFGGNPPSVKWQQINTPAARIIFPQGMDSTALRVAAVITRINDAVKSTIGNKQRQVSIVLQNQTTETNGYVGLAPFRSEFYLTPQQNSFELGALPWAEMLAVHEFRHVQQYNNFNVGLSKALRTVFGEGGQAIGNSLSVPDWFYEGDAVYNETLVSKQGRGRLPFFFNDFRGLWVADKKYSWMKLRNGSYVDYVPTHYPLGYMVVAYGRETYGDDFWRKVTQDAAAYKQGIYPFQKAIKKYSGKHYKVFTDSAINYFKQQFNDKPTPSPSAHFVADEEFPVYIDDSTFIYLKSSYDNIPRFIIRTGTKEKMIASRGLAIDHYFAYNNGKIIYSGYRPDARWGYCNYSEIRVIDVNTGSEKAITRKSKYFSPALSGDGKRIVAAEVAT